MTPSTSHWFSVGPPVLNVRCEGVSDGEGGDAATATCLVPITVRRGLRVEGGGGTYGETF
jgi:hypothetical protein